MRSRLGERAIPDSAETYRNKAARARRLAESLPAGDVTGRALRELAAAYDAAALEAERAERGRPG
jgi:hypothetical protein